MSTSKPWHNMSSLRTGRSFDLGKMSLPQLWIAYLTYPTILLYFALILAAAFGALHFSHSLWKTLIPVPVVIAVYPLAWYMIHRYILHGRWLYRNHWTAALWKRIHFDHHQDPIFWLCCSAHRSTRFRQWRSSPCQSGISSAAGAVRSVLSPQRWS